MAERDQTMRHEAHQRKQGEQRGRGPGDGPVRPLPLGFDPQMPSGFFKGDFHIPAQDEPGDDRLGGQVQVGTEHSTIKDFSAHNP